MSVRIVACWLGVMLCLAVAHPQRPASDAELSHLAGARARALLLFFVASDCPISNRYFPEMKRLAGEFAPEGVSTWYVYPNLGETPHGVGAHQREFGASDGVATLDERGSLTLMTHVTTTPEAALLVRKGATWNVVYRGRIDDRYVHFGVERQHAEHHDLEVAVRAALLGRAVPAAGGPPVGCALVGKPFVVGASR